MNRLENKIDVVIVRGPRVRRWNGPGQQALTAMCLEFGLKILKIGGDEERVLGMIPLGDTGVRVVWQDAEGRLRDQVARSGVRLVTAEAFSVPFDGWLQGGVIPHETAEVLLEKARLSWNPAVAILGSGNKAFRLGTQLKKNGVPEVLCIEPNPELWGAKKFSGWEVEKRRFESVGGKLAWGQPLKISAKGSHLFECRIQDSVGIRILDVSRVVSVGPFRKAQHFREYPAGSSCYEFEQTAASVRTDDIEGWIQEEERARMIGVRLVRALLPDLGPKRDRWESLYRRSKQRLRELEQHWDHPQLWSYDGKWLSAESRDRLTADSGVPKESHRTRPLASIECAEPIVCRHCETVCPTRAIQIERNDVRGVFEKRLNEVDCTGCGICVVSCPSQAIVMIEDSDDRSLAQVSFPFSAEVNHRDRVQVLNRRGENLETARVLHYEAGRADVAVSKHLVWEARTLRVRRVEEARQVEEFSTVYREEPRIDVEVDGEKRRIRTGIPLGLSLFEMKKNRPEDLLQCADGSCGLCAVEVGGERKLACKTQVSAGDRVETRLQRLVGPTFPFNPSCELCPCKGLAVEAFRTQVQSGGDGTPEGIQQRTSIGSGRCHGAICNGLMRMEWLRHGMNGNQWIDWQFPSADWSVSLGNQYESSRKKSDNR